MIQIHATIWRPYMNSLGEQEFTKAVAERIVQEIELSGYNKVCIVQKETVVK